MDIFKKSDYDKLRDIHDSHCLTIYMPTHRSNEKGEGIKKDQTVLKNQLKEAEKQLLILEVKEDEIDQFLKPVKELIDDIDFWKYRSDGLVIFYSKKGLKTYSIPRLFTPFTYVGHQFYLKPMTALLHGSGRHFILQLSLGDVKFYEATENTISEVIIDDLVPQNLTEAVGSDYEYAHLEKRSGQGEQGVSGGMYHGHGDGSETEKKKEAAKFFRKVDEGLMKMLHDENAPLVVACVDYLFPIYKDVNTYKYLEKSHVSGNYEHENPAELKEKAWRIINKKFDKEKEAEKEKVKALLNENKASTKLEEIIHASITGRTSTLFIKKNEEVWGKYFEKDGSVEIHQVRKTGDTGLLNLAAMKTVENGGGVYIIPKEDMPFDESISNAVFRYAM